MLVTNEQHLQNPKKNAPDIDGTRAESGGGLSVLLLCDDHPGHAGTILDHIDAFVNLSRHRVKTLNPRNVSHCRLLDLNEFDVVVIHYSLTIISDAYLAPAFRDKIARFKGLKIQMIQDDYRWVDDMTAMIRYLGINILFTLVPESEISKIWTERLPGVACIPTLAGYVPDRLVGYPTPPVDQRPLDVVYRGRELPYWIGRLGQDKVRVGREFLRHVEGRGLTCDIAWREEDRIYGTEWNAFLSSARVALGCESGASITDFDGSIEQGVKDYLTAHPNADFEEVHAATLAPHEGNVKMNVISPRIFETIALRTPLVLFRGHYMGIVEPGKHYLLLEKDFSNIDEVIEKIGDPAFLQAMADRAYADIVESGRYSLRAFMQQFDETVSTCGKRRIHRPPLRFYLSRCELYLRKHEHRLISYSTSSKRTQLRLVLRILRQHPGLLLLLMRHVATTLFRGKKHSLFMTLKELVRLQLLGEAVRGYFTVERVFRIFIKGGDDQGELLLISLPMEAEDERSLTDGWGDDVVWDRETFQQRLHEALTNSQFPRIRWDNTRIGSHAEYATLPGRQVVIPIGHEGYFEFSALMSIGKRYPDQMSLILAKILVPLGEERRTPQVLLKHTLTHRFVSHPRSFLLKVWFSIRTFRKEKHLRLLLRNYLSDPGIRSKTSIQELVHDLLRLASVGESQRRQPDDRHPYVVVAEMDELKRRLKLTSIPTSATAPPLNGDPVSLKLDGPSRDALKQRLRKAFAEDRLTHMVWDHSKSKTRIAFPTSNSEKYLIDLGDANVYEFTSLCTLGRRFPEEVSQAISQALTVGANA
ncbi:MAG: glycosyltransferase family 1 protein [Planctomycetes bacterium]|nr:glycosyltransferase family 1 protein [Planctomycetota bacterium]